MDFNTCLSKWKEAEIRVLNHIRTKYPSAFMIEWYCKWKDIFVPEKNISIEVKYDIVSEKTGNFMFEALCNWYPSWITTTESQWWVMCDTQRMNYFTIEQIFEVIIRNTIWLKYYYWEFDNDKIEMAWYLVPKQLLWK